MSITAIDTSSLLANSFTSTAASTVAATSSSSSGEVSGHRHHHRGDAEQFMQDVKQALSQLGKRRTSRRKFNQRGRIERKL